MAGKELELVPVRARAQDKFWWRGSCLGYRAGTWDGFSAWKS